MRFVVQSVRAVPLETGDGFLVLDDAVVRLDSQGKARLPVRLRRVRTADARVLTLISNDLNKEWPGFYRRRAPEVFMRRRYDTAEPKH